MSNSYKNKYILHSLDDLGEVNTNVIEHLGDVVALSDVVVYNVKLVISELVINGFKHGNRCEKPLYLDINLPDVRRKLSITVDDGGRGFDAHKNKDYAEVDSEDGRGLILVRAFTNDIKYYNNGSKVQVCINLK